MSGRSIRWLMLVAVLSTTVGCETVTNMASKVGSVFSAKDGEREETKETKESGASSAAADGELAEREAVNDPQQAGSSPRTAALRRAGSDPKPRGRVGNASDGVVVHPVPGMPLVRGQSGILASVEQAISILQQEGEKVASSRVDFFASEPIGRAYFRGTRHGVLVVGEPRDTCSYTSAHVGYATIEEGVTDGLITCVEYLSAVGTLLKQDCGCRLAGVDDHIFVEPRRLRIGDRTPILHVHQPRQGGDTIAYYGQIQFAPSFPGTVPVKIYSIGTNDPVCEGQASATSDRQGELRMSCRIDESDPESVTGSWRIEGKYLRKPYGEFRMQSANRLHIVLFGIAPKNMPQRLEECCNRPASSADTQKNN